MSLPDGYSVRPASRSDAEVITEMFIEQEVLINGEPESTPEDLFDDWATPGFVIERDTWTVFSGDELVGYCGIVKNIPPDIYAAYGAVRPSHWDRGIGNYLFDVVERRAVEIADGPASVRQWVDAKDERAIELLIRRGYEFVRRFWRMDISLEQELPSPGEPEGISIRGFVKGSDERTAHDVLEAAFAEHWGFSPRTYEQAAESRWEAGWFHPEMSLVAEADGSMVAVCINGPRLSDGYVEDLGVLPDWRGRGVAETLLRRSFSIFKEQGKRRACLNVDSDNSTGAMRLYERVGMRPATSYDVYQSHVLS